MPEKTIHPTAFIGDGVTLGTDVAIGPYAVILGPATIGDRVWIGAGASIGSPPEISSLRQNTAWTGDLEHRGVDIADDVVIREHVVVHQGSHRPTSVGRGSWLLNSSYLAHDVVLGEEVTISAGVSIGGHVRVGDRVNIGMNAVVHQRRVIGAGAMIGMATALSRDVPPFAKVFGNPPRLRGLNLVGLRRSGIDEATIEALEASYRRGDTLLVDDRALSAIADQVSEWTAHENRAPVRADPVSENGMG